MDKTGNYPPKELAKEQAMDFPQRIRLARRHAGCSQSQLAELIGVRRSAVSQWESSAGKSPSLVHLQTLAVVTGVNFEWLATGRGERLICRETALDGIEATTGLLIDDTLELRLIRAFRDVAVQARLPLVEVAEALSRSKPGRRRQQAEP